MEITDKERDISVEAFLKRTTYNDKDKEKAKEKEKYDKITAKNLKEFRENEKKKELKKREYKENRLKKEKENKKKHDEMKRSLIKAIEDNARKVKEFEENGLTSQFLPMLAFKKDSRSSEDEGDSDVSTDPGASKKIKKKKSKKKRKSSKKEKKNKKRKNREANIHTLEEIRNDEG